MQITVPNIAGYKIKAGLVWFATTTQHNFCAKDPWLEKTLQEEDKLETDDSVAEMFTIPLEGAGPNLAELHAGILDIVLSFWTSSCKHLNAFRCLQWTIVLFGCNTWTLSILLSGQMLFTLVQILFSLPASNENLESFSTVNVIEGDKRCALSNEALNDLLLWTWRCYARFQPRPYSIHLWRESRTRRPQQKETGAEIYM